MRQKMRPREYLQYRFDRFMSSGPKSILITLVIMFWLAYLLTAGIRIGVNHIVPAKLDAQGNQVELSLDEELWLTLMQITDPGAMAYDGDAGLGIAHWVFRIVGFLTILTGLIFFSMVIAFITTQLEQKLDSLKKGHSKVIVKDHILILGFAERSLEIVRELLLALGEKSRSYIVILAEQDKVEVNEYFRQYVPNRGNTKIITRNGNPGSMEALNRVSIAEAHSVIILPHCSEAAPEEEKEISDAKVIKTVLGVVAALKYRSKKPDIIVQTFDTELRPIVEDLSPGKIHFINTEEIIARIIVQTSRTMGLAAVYSQLIAFSGMEFYFTKNNAVGLSFREASYRFPNSILAGVRTREGQLNFRPGADYILRSDDDLILLTGMKSELAFDSSPSLLPRSFPVSEKITERKMEKELVIGWNSRAAIAICEYFKYLLPESQIDILLHRLDKEAIREIKSIQKKCPQRKITIEGGFSKRRNDLEEMELTAYDNIIIFNKTEEDMEKVDSATIATLLIIRKIFREYRERTGENVKTKLITEVMNSDNLEIISHTGVNDFIISNQLISRIYAQVAMDPGFMQIYSELFTEERSEIYLKPVSFYFKPPIPENLRFIDVMEAAMKRGEVAIGYQIRHSGHFINEGIVLNPAKNGGIVINSEDAIIVISENET